MSEVELKFKVGLWSAITASLLPAAWFVLLGIALINAGLSSVRQWLGGDPLPGSPEDTYVVILMALGTIVYAAGQSWAMFKFSTIYDYADPIEVRSRCVPWGVGLLIFSVIFTVLLFAT